MSALNSEPRAYTGPYPIRSHRTVAEVWAAEARDRERALRIAACPIRKLPAEPANRPTRSVQPRHARVWCEQCQRRLLIQEVDACTQPHCGVRKDRAA